MNLGLPEMIFIFLLALLIFGPRKLPEIGRQIGKAMAEFKKASNEFKAQIEGEMRNLELEELAKEAAKHPPEPQILPPEGSVPTEISAAAVAGHDPDAGLSGASVDPHPSPNPGERVGHPAALDAPSFDFPPPEVAQDLPAEGGRATPAPDAPTDFPAEGGRATPEQAKAADV